MAQEQGAGARPSSAPHIPVMLAEVLEALNPLQGGRFVDGTFGAGGYSRALLAAGAQVAAIDRDPNVVVFAKELLQAFPGRFSFSAGRFSALDSLVQGTFDGVVLDVGVSSMQIDAAERGFSFMRDGPLDMRMSAQGPSAAELVNTLDETALAQLLFVFGEERKSRRIAAAIVRERDTKPFATTAELATLIERTIGRKPGDMHPATRSFQALRIAVNDELDELVEGLFAAERLLPEGGRLVVVSFHSLEDRIVKRFFSPEKSAPVQSRHLPRTTPEPLRWRDVAKSVKAGRAELEANPRARSATLRSGVRSASAARPVRHEGLGVPRFRGSA